MINLKEDDSEIEINSVGAKINLLVLSGQKLLGQFKRSDGKSACTHPCSPNFGPETQTKFGLSQHGPARNQNWQICERSTNKIVLETTIKEGNYPDGLCVAQTFSLDKNKLIIETTHTNNGIISLPVNFGEHFYWDAPQGFDNTKLNDQNISNKILQDASFKWKNNNLVEIPGQPQIKIDQTGLDWCNLWIMPSDDKYVCIEPVEGQPRSSFFGSQASLIKPGQKRRTKIIISI